MSVHAAQDTEASQRQRESAVGEREGEDTLKHTHTKN